MMPRSVFNAVDMTSCSTRKTIAYRSCLILLFIICVAIGYLLKTMQSESISYTNMTPLNNMLKRKFSGIRGKETCDIKRNFMFVKVHKAGSTTTTCILQRFGYEHNLTFVLPMSKKSDVGWPNFFKREDFIPSADGTFNVLVDHTVYNRRLLEHIMPPDTVYIAILRHPLSHLRSIFNWYHLAGQFQGLTGSDPVASFLEDPLKFQIPFVTRSRKPYTLTKNFMAYDLGFPPVLFNDKSAVSEFVQKTSRELSLVIILEHFHESLVLLRRIMCWELKDILFNGEPQNQRKYKKPEIYPASLIKMHRRWSNVDYALYDYFNATLWKKIQNQNNDFYQEVHYFKKLIQSTNAYCTKAVIIRRAAESKAPNETVVRAWTVNGSAVKLTIPRSAWNDEFEIDPYLCLRLKMEYRDWEHVLKKKHKLMPQNSSDTFRSTIQYYSPLGILDENLLWKVFHIKGPDKTI